MSEVSGVCKLEWATKWLVKTVNKAKWDNDASSVNDDLFHKYCF